MSFSFYRLSDYITDPADFSIVIKNTSDLKSEADIYKTNTKAKITIAMIKATANAIPFKTAIKTPLRDVFFLGLLTIIIIMLFS